MEKVKITFIDGTFIDADVNGDCFIVDEKPTFPEDISIIFVDDGENVEVLDHVVIQESASVDGRYWFTFVKMSEIEIRFAEIEDALCELSME
jgi:hypothetical protein